MSAVLLEDEAYVGKARIYHRYRIPNLYGQSGKNGIRAVHQQPLPFITREDEQGILDMLVSPTSSDVDKLRQQRLRDVASQEAASLESAIKPLNTARYAGFEEYVARHEEHAKLVVRLFHTDIPNPKQVHQFRAFRILSNPSDMFLFNAPGPLVDACLKRIVAVTTPKMDVWYPQLDLQKLADMGTTLIRGASFSIRDRPNLKTAMVYGPGVNEDDAWEEYSRIGELRYVHLQLVFATTEVKLMVTRRGSLMPYGIDDIGEELNLCRDVYDQYLKQFEVGEQPLVRRKSRKV